MLWQANATYGPSGPLAPTRDYLTYMPEVMGSYVARQCTSEVLTSFMNALMSMLFILWFDQCAVFALSCDRTSPLQSSTEMPFWHHECVEFYLLSSVTWIYHIFVQLICSYVLPFFMQKSPVILDKAVGRMQCARVIDGRRYRPAKNQWR